MAKPVHSQVSGVLVLVQGGQQVTGVQINNKYHFQWWQTLSRQSGRVLLQKVMGGRGGAAALERAKPF